MMCLVWKAKSLEKYGKAWVYTGSTKTPAFTNQKTDWDFQIFGDSSQTKRLSNHLGTPSVYVSTRVTTQRVHFDWKKIKMTSSFPASHIEQYRALIFNASDFLMAAITKRDIR
jgi:hypothetical protein